MTRDDFDRCIARLIARFGDAYWTPERKDVYFDEVVHLPESVLERAIEPIISAKRSVQPLIPDLRRIIQKQEDSPAKAQEGPAHAASSIAALPPDPPIENQLSQARAQAGAFCSLCEGNGFVTAYYRDPKYAIYEVIFKCSCPRGRARRHNIPVWSGLYLKTYKLKA